MPVKSVDLSHSEVIYVGFDKTNPTNSFRAFWKSLQNARVVPNPVSVYSPDAQSEIQDLPNEIKDKIYCAVKAQVFSKDNIWERRLFESHTAINLWKKQIGVATLFFVILDIIIGK